MTTMLKSTARKRPVNLTLNEELVLKAKALTDNLSGVVESLLAEFVEREDRVRLEKFKAVQAAVTAWNTFSSEGSIADEYASL